jgi:hypothetical protein
VLLRGLKRYDEVQQIRTVFNDPGIVLRHTEISPPEEVFANRMARTLYEAIDGDRSVAQLLLHVHGSEYVVTKFLYELHRNGLVTVAGVKRIVPVADNEGQVETAPSVELPAAERETRVATVETESANDAPGTPSPPVGPAPDAAAPGDNDSSLTSGAEAPGVSDAESLTVIENPPSTVSDGTGPTGDEAERAAPEAALYSNETPGLSDAEAPSPASPTSPAQMPAPTEDLLADWEPNIDLPLDVAAASSPDSQPAPPPKPPETHEADPVADTEDTEAPVDSVEKAADDTPDEGPGGLESLEKSDAHRLVSQLEAARRRMAKAEFEEALDILDGLYRQFPGDESLRRMTAEAEAAFVERAYRHYLPPTKVPALTKPMEELECENLSPTEFFLLSRIDGSWDIKSIIQIAPLREADALRTLKRMRENGVIVLHEPQPVGSEQSSSD